MGHTIVIFGASGDLTSRKLIPALYSLFRKKRLPEGTRIVGFSRTPFTHEAWREKLAGSTREFEGGEFDHDVWSQFASSIFYQAGDIDKPDSFTALKTALDQIEKGE